MKKVVSMVLVAAVLCLGLVFVSCGPACPGGGSVGDDKGACEYSLDFTNYTAVGKACDNSDCGVYAYYKDKEQQAKDFANGKKIKKTCDC